MKEVYFKGNFVPFAEAKVGVMTHAFNYGTGCFEGIRGYWNKDKKQLLLLRLEEHYQRLLTSCQIIKIKLKHSAKEMCEKTIELAKRNNYKEDVYIRPLAYKSEEKIGLGLTGITDDLTIYMTPFGEYLDLAKGIRVCTSTWRTIPPRGKITGLYINSSLAKADAIENGFDEAIMLTSEDHVSEGTGENIFMVKQGKLITPPLDDDILEGITRASILHLAKEDLKLETEVRSMERWEIYTCDELFLCGTGAQVSPVISVDNRIIGNNKTGPVTALVQKAYFDAVKGHNPKYSHWLTPVY